MDICIDIGNTTVALAVYHNKKLLNKSFFLTSSHSIVEDYLQCLKKMNVHDDDIQRIMYSSVVPHIDEILLAFLKKHYPQKVWELKKCEHGLTLTTDPSVFIGDDLIADLVGATEKYGYPSIIVDLGTASKILLLDDKGTFGICMIVPGLSMSISSLMKRTALLPEVEIKAPTTCLARNTNDAINAGTIYGHASMIDGLVERMEKELGYKCKHILTGGSQIYIAGLLKNDFIIDSTLCVDGLEFILERNAK